MNTRIAEIIKKENLTNSQFAQLVGIQASAVTHLLNGRNEPSLQVTRKILDTFRGINSDWLILGIGDMYRKAPESTENKEITKQKPQTQPYQQSLFPDVPIPTSEYGKENELSNKENTASEISAPTTAETNMSQIYSTPYPQQQEQIVQNPQPIQQQVKPVETVPEKKEKQESTPVPPRIVKKIIVFYSDNTYEEYGAQLNN